MKASRYFARDGAASLFFVDRHTSFRGISPCCDAIKLLFYIPVMRRVFRHVKMMKFPNGFCFSIAYRLEFEGIFDAFLGNISCIKARKQNKFL